MKPKKYCFTMKPALFQRLQQLAGIHGATAKAGPTFGEPSPNALVSAIAAGEIQIVTHYKARPMGSRAWGFSTPTAVLRGFASEVKAQGAADTQRIEDEAEAKTGTGSVAEALRGWFEREVGL